MRAALAGGAGSHATLDREIDRIAKIVDHQLQRAATSGGATLGQPAVPVAPLVADLRIAMCKVHARKDLTIDADVAPDAGFVGDAGDITELLGNLVDNACKWCRGRVRVQARLDPARAPARSLVIRVEDDGPGIAPADRDRVTGRGVRADEHQDGHGLGLAMVADTVASIWWRAGDRRIAIPAWRQPGNSLARPGARIRRVNIRTMRSTDTISWQPTSWQTRKAQQQPSYDDSGELERAVADLSQTPADRGVVGNRESAPAAGRGAAR